MSGSFQSSRSYHEELLERENNFSLSGINHQPLRAYNALYDPNLRQHFKNKAIRSHLRQTGVVSPQNSKKNPIRQRSAHAKSENEQNRSEKNVLSQQEENELRRRVYMKRVEEIERDRQRKRIQQLKTEKEIAREIVRVARGYVY